MTAPKARIGLSGCGAVTELYYAPALVRMHARGRLAECVLFDADPSRAVALARSIPESRAAAEFGDLLTADLVIVASPPRFHAEQVLSALERGCAVLCEKPMAPTAADAARMAEAARQGGGTLAVNHIRRHLGPARAIKHLLSTGALGDLRSISVFEGGPFAWPVGSPAYFTRELSGGGVVPDIGTHILDLLLWWVGLPSSIALETDAMGGVEANCVLRLDYRGGAATIRLSRDWARPNQVRLEGSAGAIVWADNDTESFRLTLRGSPDLACDVRAAPEHRAEPRDFVEAFVESMEDALDAKIEKRPPAATGDDGVRVAELVECALASRRLLAMPWLDEAEGIAARRLADT